jgi:hypothetical protein
MSLVTVCFLKGLSFLNLQGDLGDARKIDKWKSSCLFYGVGIFWRVSLNESIILLFWLENEPPPSVPPFIIFE